MAKNPEQPPKPKDWRFQLRFGEAIYLCHRGNTFAFMHNEEPEGDHLYQFVMGENNEVLEDRYFWRHQITNFDSTVSKMQRNGYTIIQEGHLTPEDRKVWNEQYPKTPLEDFWIPKIISEDFISPRQQTELEHLTDYIMWLVEHDRFNGDGDVSL